MHASSYLRNCQLLLYKLAFAITSFSEPDIASSHLDIASSHLVIASSHLVIALFTPSYCTG